MKCSNLFTATITTLALFVASSVQNELWAEKTITIEDKYFKSILISEDFEFEDSYLLTAADFTNDGYPDIITYGLGGYDPETNTPFVTDIYLFTNPKVSLDDGSQTWKSEVIYSLQTPVAIDHADIDGDGWVDILMSTEYGKNIVEPLDGGGIVFWLKNPGNKKNQTWERRDIGNDTAMHRVVVGQFTQDKQMELITLPVVGRPHNIHSAIPVALYKKPKNIHHVAPWPKEYIMESYFHLIHDAWVGKNPELSDHDVLLVGSQEGITWLYYGRKGKWQIKNISPGETSLDDYIDPKTNKPKTKMWFTGTNTASSGMVKGKPNQFVTAIEPFHGGNLVTYVKNGDNWNRHVINKYGKVDEQGFSVGHYTVTNDFDEDGTDEFLAAFPREPKGIIYGRLKDYRNNKFDIVRIFDQSVSRISVADFNKDGKKDNAKKDNENKVVSLDAFRKK
ncbi:MAG: VCBS repeat-containing protein [Candidatus Polarisedimenticolaceae bacterium]|nr:VCBS repeat-containing protein [Candidatus Polarisedimenticolaceae bacterium]